MIDTSSKQETKRLAKARAEIVLGEKIVNEIKNQKIPKGNVLEHARIAGILAAKRTPELIPLCHNIYLDCVKIDFFVKKDCIWIESEVISTGKTGVEMEAVSAVSIAALTIYDMCKFLSKSINITNIELLEKKGGKSGHYKKR
jgi:cyclic pyranopterin phosphate synthase